MQVLLIQFPGLPALCFDGLNNLPLEQQSPSASLSEMMGPILYAVQRNRRSIERRLTRKNVIPLKRTAIPKTNIVTCLHCGNLHEIQTICGKFTRTIKGALPTIINLMILQCRFPSQLWRVTYWIMTLIWFFVKILCFLTQSLTAYRLTV